MSYRLAFDVAALKEWRKLTKPIQEQFKKKLGHVLENPKVPSQRLRSLENCYKIKLRSSGYRLVYQVQDTTITVLVVAIGKRDKSSVYKKAQHRLD